MLDLPDGTGYVFQFTLDAEAFKLWEVVNCPLLQPPTFLRFGMKWAEYGPDKTFVAIELGYEGWVGAAAAIGSFIVFFAIAVLLGRKHEDVSFTQMAKIEEDMVQFPFIRSRPGGPDTHNLH